MARGTERRVPQRALDSAFLPENGTPWNKRGFCRVFVFSSLLSNKKFFLSFLSGPVQKGRGLLKIHYLVLRRENEHKMYRSCGNPY